MPYLRFATQAQTVIKTSVNTNAEAVAGTMTLESFQPRETIEWSVANSISEPLQSRFAPEKLRLSATHLLSYKISHYM